MKSLSPRRLSRVHCFRFHAFAFINSTLAITVVAATEPADRIARVEAGLAPRHG